MEYRVVWFNHTIRLGLGGQGRGFSTRGGVLIRRGREGLEVVADGGLGDGGASAMNRLPQLLLEIFGRVLQGKLTRGSMGWFPFMK
jgi:hypothetical protein